VGHILIQTEYRKGAGEVGLVTCPKVGL